MKKLILGLVFSLYFCVNAISSEIINKIENHWNEINTMSGQFKQKDPDGVILIGNFYFLKPYKSKFVYNDKPENIITNDSLLIIVDDNDYKIESYLIGNNILKKLLSNELSFHEQFDLINHTSTDDQYILKLKIKNQENNHLKIFFDRDTFDIKKWEIYDEFQNKTVFEFTKIKKNIFISQNLFVVNYK